MKDNRVERLADILVNYSTRVSEGDRVHLKGTHLAEPLLLALYERCLQKGAHPRLKVHLPHSEPIFYRHANDEQLAYVWDTDEWESENLDVSIYIISDANTKQLSNIDPARQVIASKARKHLQDRLMQRAADGQFRWNVTLFPTEGLAIDAEMALDEYEDFYYGACLVDSPDPVKEWQKVAERHARMLEWIKGRKEVHITGEGTDLYLDVTDRIWMPADGLENFPDGEIFTGPRENGTRGHVTYTFPANYGGVSVEGIRLEFEAGKVVEATARKNEDYLIKKLDTDPGARVLGEIGIGTNYGIKDFSGEILLDEKIGGTVHLALGASYPETGGVNDSAIHWDMVCDLRKGGRITVDGDTLMEDGKLTI